MNKIIKLLGLALFFPIFIILFGAVSSLKWRQITDVITTLTEINYVHGVTSAIQTQLDAKPDTSNVITPTEADAKYLQLTDTIPFSSIAYNRTEVDVLLKSIPMQRVWPIDGAASGLPASTTGNTNENTVLTFTIAADKIGTNTAFHIISLISATNNANAKTVRVKFNGKNGCSVDVTSCATINTYAILRNRKSKTAQISGNTTATSVHGGFGSKSGTAVTTYTVDTSADVTVAVTLQNGVGTDTITMEDFRILLD